MVQKTALVYRTDESGIKASVETFEDYRDMQNFVNGYIERVVIPFRIGDTDYDVYVNEEGLFTETLPSMVLFYKGKIHNVIKGNFFISKADEDGESVSLSENEIKEIREYIDKNTRDFRYKNETGEEVSTKLFVATY